MEQQLELERNLRNRQPSAASSTSRTVPAGSQSPQLPERSKPKEKHLSYSDLHRHITESVEEISKKQNKKAAEEEELVKYMSNLPSYLEKGRAQQEKFLNVGVLDWSRLEKWQYSSSHHRRLSVSSNNSCSSFVSEGSSVNSSRGQSSSPSRQRMRHPSLQFHLSSLSPSSATRHSQILNSSDEGDGNSHDHHSRLATDTRSAEQATYTRMDKAISEDPLELSFDQWRRRKDVTGQKMNSRSSVSGVKCKTQEVVRDKMKVIDQGYTRRPDKMQERKVNVIDRENCQKSEPVVLLLPKDDANGSRSGIPKCPKSTMILGRRSAEVHHRSSLQKPREIHYTVVSSNVPHSCPLPYESDREVEAQNSFSPHSSQSAHHQAEVSEEPSNLCITVEANVTQRNAAGLRETSSGANLKLDKLTPPEKIRSTSPFRRLSMGMGKITRSLIPKETAAVPQSTSSCKSANSGSEDGIAVGQATSSGRSRSSPLRRLLDPLLKPKVPQNCHLTRGRDVNSSVDTCCKSSDRQVCSSSPSSHPAGRVSLDATNVRDTSVKDFPLKMKKKSSAFQALLRVAVKNGQPLFTFAVNNQPDILAATMKKLSSASDDGYIYTFFSIQEAKKKNGSWMNHQKGGKGKGKTHEYVPNVVAQLRVSGLTGSDYLEQQHCAAREFVLFAVDLLPQSEPQQQEQQTLEFQPNDELAAVVVKVPRTVINKKTMRHEPEPESGCNLQQGGSRSASSQTAQYQHRVVANESFISVTAVLPGGVHSIPTTKEGPSSLLQRWKSGGSCDCGGWDLGCNLRVLDNNTNEFNQKPVPFQPCSTTTDKFDLIPQGGEGNNEPVFSLAPYKDGIHTVEFHSLLSPLQAFALCIAVVDGKKLIEVEESCSSLEGKATLDALLAQNDAWTGGPGIGGEIPARYVSYPPVSPVGRV
ncbi:unnamed protein product [Linum trigynum]|uniref:Uncharacterized protein n=1 Tax=Linum trigynum TaxID=586398 RepID=A0AAV2FUW2_9ROSI